jgi:bifunctional non-homologous end joining protein LigD
MTCSRLTPEEIERADAAYRRGWRPVLTPGLIPRPNPDVNWRPGDRTRPGSHPGPAARGAARPMCGSAAGSPAPARAGTWPGRCPWGLPRPGALVFAGTVGSGLSMAELRELTALLQSVEQPVAPFTGPLPPEITRQARWARPVLAAEVTYLERTPSGRLRQPVWRGLRSG